MTDAASGEKPTLDGEIITEPAEPSATLPEVIPGGFQNPPPRAPDYFKDSDGNYVPPPEGVTFGDWMLRPGKPLSYRHKKVAEYFALGKTTNEIAELLGYTAQRVSVLRGNTQIQQEADRFRDKLFSASVQDQLHTLGPDAVATIEEVLRSDTEKLSTRADTARWLLEKLTGKARQEVGVDAGASLMELLKKLDSLKGTSGTEGRDVIELSQTPQTAPEDKWMDAWLDQNIPGVENEKSEGGTGE